MARVAWPGDSLWGLLRQYNDLEAFNDEEISQIVLANGMDDAVIHPGDVFKVTCDAATLS